MAQTSKAVILPVGEDTFSSGMMTAHRYMEWVLDPFKEFLGRNVLEVGCGHGGYGQRISQQSRYTGLDLSNDLIETLKRKHPDQTFICADITDAKVIEDLKSKEYDTILCLNVLEHIEKDKEAAQAMLSVLKPGGHLILFVPAFQQLYTEMDRLAGHFRRYKVKDLDALFDKGKVRFIKTGYFNSLGGVGWFANKANKPKTLNDQSVNTQLIFFDKYLVPVARFFDIFTSKFFGQSVYVVVQKL